MFERSFFEVWSHTPFGPSSAVREFVERFVVNGAFDAQRFWEHVANSLAEHEAQTPKGSDGKRASAAAGRD
jgi:hypothetical protein